MKRNPKNIARNPALVPLNVNPCKMCMPMGSVSALCGIKGCMNILHGSQGCATYIRRHMATHYNEPVDIASSSLTEEGTVFGGEKNLVKGLDNLITLYNPEVIGVSATCLAETIGEDVPRMIQNYLSARPEVKTKIVAVSSAGYAGTQYEGFFRALRAVVEQADMNPRPNSKVNVITGMISPADTRFLKALLAEMGVDAVLLPDISENLDGGHETAYKRLSESGTALKDIALMAGAKLSIEVASFVSEEYSPGRYLEREFGVPLARTPLPVGLRDTDAFIGLLEKAGGKRTAALQKQRARFLDAMVDSHKHNARLRAAVFGEPDFVYGVCRLLAENGALPAVAATGTVCKSLAAALEADIDAAKRFHLEEKAVVIDDCDFDTVERCARDMKVNVLVGNSDGRRIEEKLYIPLIRAAFPIHDHIGGQRVRTLGYEGALTLLDRITNALLSQTEHTFRQELYDKYYTSEKKEEHDMGTESVQAKTTVEETPVLFAVSSKGGVLVDQHFGHATDFYIYEHRGGEARFKERRSVSQYCGPDDCDGKASKLDATVAVIRDCACVITMRIGDAPMSALHKRGIKTFTTYNRIEDAVKEAAELLASSKETAAFSRY